jgi:hypothetical protein
MEGAAWAACGMAHFATTLEAALIFLFLDLFI